MIVNVTVSFLGNRGWKTDAKPLRGDTAIAQGAGRG
jgi:hypothetical protein